MNKLSLVLSLAAVAAVSGCLDPQYKSKRTATQEPTVVKPAVSSEPVEPVTPVDVTPDPAPAVNIDVVDTPDPKPVEVKPVVLRIPVRDPAPLKDFPPRIVHRIVRHLNQRLVERLRNRVRVSAVQIAPLAVPEHNPQHKHLRQRSLPRARRK